MILPVRDEPRLNEFLGALHQTLIDDYEIIVVMGDREKLYPELPPHPCLRVVHSFADNLERAILMGFSVAQGDRLLVMDSDGSHPVEMVPYMLNQLATYELAVGSRYLDGSRFEQSAFRKLVSWCFRWAAWLRGSKLSDPMSGFFAVRREVVERTRFKPLKWKTCLEIELKARPRTVEIPINFRKRVAGASKTKLITGIHLIYDLVTL